jgi:rhodanese-related sulfurtransferase
MTQTITRDELRAGLDAGTITAVDALPESYYAQQHIPGALNLVADDVAARAAALLPDRDGRHRHLLQQHRVRQQRSRRHRPHQARLHHVRTYAEGIQDWVEAGLPTEAGLLAPQ